MPLVKMGGEVAEGTEYGLDTETLATSLRRREPVPPCSLYKAHNSLLLQTLMPVATAGAGWLHWVNLWLGWSA